MKIKELAGEKSNQKRVEMHNGDVETGSDDGHAEDRVSLIDTISKKLSIFTVEEEEKNDVKTRLRQLSDQQKCIFYPDDPLKTFWDTIVSFLLIIVFFFTPYRIAFHEKESWYWIVIDQSIDFLFLIDIVVTFFSAYFDSQQNLIVKRKQIACHYIATWFFIDVIAIIPFNLIFSTKDISSLVRFSRLSKLGKLVKLMRLVRLLKILKDKNKITHLINSFIPVNSAYE